MGGQPSAPLGGLETEQVKPLKPPPAEAAPERRLAGPVEPWGESLKTLMLVFGVLLVACFVAPWSVSEGGTVFSWTLLQAEGPFQQKLVPLFFAATGVLAVVLGALPLGAFARGTTAAAVSLTPIVFALGVGDLLGLVEDAAAVPPIVSASVAGAFAWQNLASLLGLILLITGLLLRSQYTGSLLARLLVTVGLVAFFVPLLVPFQLIDTLKAITAGSIRQQVGLALGWVPLLVAVLSLLCWLPSSTRAAAGLFAWLLIAWWMVVGVGLPSGGGGGLAALFLGDNIVESLKTGLVATLYTPLSWVAWFAMAAHGLATILGKQLET